MQKKRINRIVGMTIKGAYVDTSQGKVYENGKHYCLVDGYGAEHKYPKWWVTELHKANAWDEGIQVIKV